VTERIRAAVRLNLPKIDSLYVWSALIGLFLALALIAIGMVLNRP
jgi:hypothetical protein